MAKRAPLICRNGCGQTIWFDWERKFDDLGYTNNSSKPNIPLEVSETGEHLPKKHQCPNSEYAKKQQSGSATETVKDNSVTTAALQGVLGNTLDIISRLDKLEHKFDELTPRFNQLVDMVTAQQGNPLDDDGDSNRENPENEP
jgi:hypothetical protein